MVIGCIGLRAIRVCQFSDNVLPQTCNTVPHTAIASIYAILPMHPEIATIYILCANLILTLCIKIEDLAGVYVHGNLCKS